MLSATPLKVKRVLSRKPDRPGELRQIWRVLAPTGARHDVWDYGFYSRCDCLERDCVHRDAVRLLGAKLESEAARA